MKFEISRNDFLKVLVDCVGFVPNRTTIPILSNFSMEIRENCLIVVASDLQKRIERRCELATDVIEGAVCVNADRLLAVIKALGNDVVTLRSAGHNLTIESGKFKSSITVSDVSEFPKEPELSDDSVDFLMGKSDIEFLLNNVKFCADESIVNGVMSGVFFEVKSDASISATAMTSAQLGKSYCYMSKEGITADVVVYPHDLAVSMIAMDDFVKIQLNEGFIVLSSDRSRVWLRTVDGKFPDYNKILNRLKVNGKVTFDGEAFLAILRRVSVMCDNVTNRIKLSFSEGLLTVSAENNSIGGGSFETMAYEGDSIEFCFNSKIIQNQVKAFGSGMVEMEFVDKKNPVFLRKKDCKDGQFYLASPMI